MRRALMAALVVSAGWMGLAPGAQAKIAITVDKDAQQMVVAVDGVTKYTWPVSSGLPSYETPNGSFQTFRMEEDHYSKEFDEAPMPNAIFFTKKGHAIHGTDSVSRLGTPASHGCVRLSRANAATLFALVKADGVMNTTVTLTGSSQIALARNPRGSKQIARREALPDTATAGDPSVIASDRPLYQRRAPMPQMADDGYIYPADGSGGRYPAPRGYRRMYDSQGNPQGYAYGGGQQYYVDRGYGAPQGYAPRGYYYQPGY